MEEVDARDLEAALAEVNSWKVELVDEAMVQQRIDWLDKARPKLIIGTLIVTLCL